MLRHHRGLRPGPSDQGDLLVVPPAHRTARTRLMARGQRAHQPTDRGTLTDKRGSKAPGRIRDVRHPQPVRYRHRLERIPHQRPIPQHPRMSTATRHTFWPIAWRLSRKPVRRDVCTYGEVYSHLSEEDRQATCLTFFERVTRTGGGADVFLDGHAASPRLLRYCRGLCQPSDFLMRVSL